MNDDTVGGIKWMRGKPYYRATLSTGARPAVLLAVDPADVNQATARAATITKVLTSLRDAGRVEYENHWLKKIARASDLAEVEGYVIAVEAICTGTLRKKSKLTGALPFQEFGEMWTEGELARMFPQHVRLKKTADDDRGFLKKYAYPVAGKVPVSAVGLEHAQEILRRVSPTKSDATVRHVAQCLHRLLKLAVFPARLIERSPLPPGFLPKIVHRRAKTYLYPEEDAQVLGHLGLALVLRLLYGFLDREGCRVSEATTLDFHDVDLDHGEIHLDANKTNDPRSWAMGSDVAEALRRWRDHFHPNPVAEARVFMYPETSRDAGAEIDSAARAEEFRQNLKKAGLTRPQLFINDNERRHICIHDLRATFVTIALAAGKTETWVSDRTGHSSSDQIHNYRRQARTHAELELGGLTPLHEAIPELRAAVPEPVHHQAAPPNGGTLGEHPQKGESQVRSETAIFPSGESGIRTHGTLTGTPDFESGSFGRSDISPPGKMPKHPVTVNVEPYSAR